MVPLSKSIDLLKAIWPDVKSILPDVHPVTVPAVSSKSLSKKSSVYESKYCWTNESVSDPIPAFPNLFVPSFPKVEWPSIKRLTPEAVSVNILLYLGFVL